MLGHQIQIGYFDQNLANFHNGNTVLEELWNEHPDLDMFKIRSVLGAFLFTADEVFKEVDVLSGGEKVRLSLAKLMMKKANFLILDEPGNASRLFQFPVVSGNSFRKCRPYAIMTSV